jgi:hypothetical protein
MELDCEKDRGMDGEHASVEDPWPCVEVFKTLAELNEQCLELLVQQASVHATPVSPMLRELRQLWCRLDADSRKRAAACPYLLVDAGFADPYRWRWVGRHRVEDREPNAFASFFTVPGISKLAHQVFTNAWYMARTQPAGVPLFLGMPAACAALIRTCSMRQITELAEQHAGWLRPRWSGRVAVWRELLLAAISGDEVALEKARLQGVQLLATELRALEQVTAAERR